MSFFTSIKNIMRIPSEDEEAEDYTAEEEEERSAVKRQASSYETAPRRESMPRVIGGGRLKNSLPEQQPMQVVLVKPDRFEDVRSIADHLNEKKTVVLNLEAANRDVSRRIVDFLSGAAYANHGDMRKVANSTFIIAPYDVDVMGDLVLDELEDGKIYF